MKTNYQITTQGEILKNNCNYEYWKSIKDAKPYDLVEVDGIEYKRAEIRCNAIKVNDDKVADKEIIKHDEPINEFQTIKFMVLSRQIGKVSTHIHLHPCPDISGFWNFFRIWSTINLINGVTIRGWLSQKSDTLEGRVERCKELYDLYINQKNLASARDLPF